MKAMASLEWCARRTLPPAVGCAARTNHLPTVGCAARTNQPVQIEP